METKHVYLFHTDDMAETYVVAAENMREARRSLLKVLDREFVKHRGIKSAKDRRRQRRFRRPTKRSRGT